MPDLINPNYNEKYFALQDPIGKFGGWANQTKFADYISSTRECFGLRLWRRVAS